MSKTYTYPNIKITKKDATLGFKLKFINGTPLHKKVNEKKLMKKNRILIGIDPDIDKSGVAIDNCGEITLCVLRFFDLFDKLKELKTLDIPMLVVVEGGWLNKGNWRKKDNGSAALNAKIGERTGANHETGRKIVEMLEHLQIPHKVVRPTKSKVNARLFKMITGITEVTNSEKRDAYMLIHNLKVK